MKRLARFGLVVAGTLFAAAAGVAEERFDYRVRDDMFRGFAGNEAAFRNAVSIIDETLQQDPDHAEALVWRGAARYWRAGQALRSGDVVSARELAEGGRADMDRALALDPGDIGVLVPRAAVLLPAARAQPNPTRQRDLARRAAGAFEAAFALRRKDFPGLGQHNRGEYLAGLAESWALAGDRERAEAYLRRIVTELPGSPYAERAAAKLGDWSDPRPLNCQTCH